MGFGPCRNLPNELKSQEICSLEYVFGDVVGHLTETGQ
jgi:hypothetical protein